MSESEQVDPARPLWSHETGEELSGHRGRWVALDGDRIVAVADSLPLVRREAREQGVTDPLVFRVPAHPRQVAAYSVSRNR